MPPTCDALRLPFDGGHVWPARRVPSRAPWVMGPRLSHQCQMIVTRLRRGPASNRELAALALKYTGRLSELRRAGYVVGIRHHDHTTGLVVYELRGEPDDAGARLTR